MPQAAEKIRISSLTHDDDGVPVKWLRLINGAPPKGGLSEQNRREIIGVCDMLEAKGKYQTAANLLYYCVTGDSNNEDLRAHWNRLVNRTNEMQREELKRRKEEAILKKSQPLNPQINASLSETAIWKDLKSKGRLPEDDPNWHLNKLKPWKAPDAMAKGNQHKQAAASKTDPFQKVFEYEEACKMFTKVLEIKPDSSEARGALNDCCSRMNSEYKRMKELKRSIRRQDPELPMTKVGDFLLSKNRWVKEMKGR